MPLGLAADQKGILPDRMIAALAKAGGIFPAYDFAPDQIQPASLDLRLGDTAYRVRASFLPGPHDGRGAHRASEAARDRARRRRGAGDRLRLHRAAARKPRAAARHRGRRQSEKLDRPARCVHARDHRPRARLRPHRGGLSRAALCGDFAEDISGAGARGLAALAASVAARPCGARRRRPRARCMRASGWSIPTMPISRAAFRSASISRAPAANALIGYRAKRHTGVIDVERRAGYDFADFWEPMRARTDATLILDPDEFYILASKEAVQVPPDYAAEMVPFDPLVGEFRVHYAGFFDPGFGYAGAGGRGAARCSKCARARCRSSSSTGRSSAASSTRGCLRGRTHSMVRASARTIRRRA